MAISFGPKLGLLFNCNIDEYYADAFRPFLQALDQLVNGSVINATQVVPPSNPNPGDAYLLSSASSGAWSTFPINSIAVWDNQVTLSGTNTLAPAWVNYVPNAGWIVWNVALASLYAFNGTSWAPLAGGANFPTNTDITSMTGIPNTTISTSGYVYNNGTLANTTEITPTGWAWGNTAGNYDVGTGGIFVANQAFTGSGYTGIGIAVQNTSGVDTVIGAGQIQTEAVNCTGVACTGNISAGTIQCNTIESFNSGTPLSLIGQGISGAGSVSVAIGGNGNLGQSVLGFSNYPTQTTVGAAGGASALPATPTGYLPIVIGSTEFVIPYYAHA